MMQNLNLNVNFLSLSLFVRFSFSYFRGTKISGIQDCYEGDYVAAKNNDLPRFLDPAQNPGFPFTTIMCPPLSEA
jgi:hypothetical protein